MANNFNHYLILGLKGVGMGAANVVPGVSGGTIALMTGIYEELIGSLNTLMSGTSWKMLFSGNIKEFWRYIHGGFLTAIIIGTLVSIFSLAKLTTYFLVHDPVQIWAFFFGLIVASSVIMFADIKGWKIKDVIFAIVGVVLGVVICTLSPTHTTNDMWFIFICGAIAMCTMILPGISGSFILLILGKYDYIMSALDKLDIPVLLVFAVGAVVGILAFSKFLHWLLKHYERPTLLILIGFVVGSLIKVWPWYDKSALAAADGLTLAADGSLLTAEGAVANLHIPGAIIWAIVGAAFVIILEYIGHRSAAKAAGSASAS